MKYLLACLIVGCLIGPTWSAEHEMTIQEFVQKIEKAEPWTKEKVEAEFGVKFTHISTTGVVTWYAAREALPPVKDLAIGSISLTVWAATNKARSLDVHFDSKLSCLTLEQVEKLFPGGYGDAEDINPGGGLLYIHERPWGELVFDFDSWRKEKSCLVIISVGTKKSDHMK